MYRPHPVRQKPPNGLRWICRAQLAAVSLPEREHLAVLEEHHSMCATGRDLQNLFACKRLDELRREIGLRIRDQRSTDSDLHHLFASQRLDELRAGAVSSHMQRASGRVKRPVHVWLDYAET